MRVGGLRIRVRAEMELRRDQNDDEAQRQDRNPEHPRRHVLHMT